VSSQSSFSLEWEYSCWELLNRHRGSGTSAVGSRYQKTCEDHDWGHWCVCVWFYFLFRVVTSYVPKTPINQLSFPNPSIVTLIHVTISNYHWCQSFEVYFEIVGNLSLLTVLVSASTHSGAQRVEGTEWFLFLPNNMKSVLFVSVILLTLFSIWRSLSNMSSTEVFVRIF
jgi:hypothetical protein